MLKRALALTLSLGLVMPGPAVAASLRSTGGIQTVALPSGPLVAAQLPNFTPGQILTTAALPSPAALGGAALLGNGVAAPKANSPAVQAKVGVTALKESINVAAAVAAAPSALAAASGIAAAAPKQSAETLNKAYDSASPKTGEAAPVLAKEVSSPRRSFLARSARIGTVGGLAAGMMLATKAFALDPARPATTVTASSDFGFWFVGISVGVSLLIWGLTKWHRHRQNQNMERISREVDNGTFNSEDDSHVFHGMGPGVAGNSYPSSQNIPAAGNAAPVKKSPLFADVAGQDEAKLELEEIVDFLKNPAEYKKLHPRYKGPKGVLVFGPPGTGKTLLARAVANEAEVPFVHRAGSDFINTYVGKGADNIREAFKEVRAKIKTKGGAGILFIDEIEAIGGARTGNSDRSEETRTINALLKEMDGFEKDNIIVIAATNMPESLDPALVRGGRFGTKIPVGLPDIVGRKAILDIHLKGAALEPDVDAQALAKQTPGLAGADLEQIVMDSVKLAKRRKAAAIGQEDLIRAIDEFTTGRQRRMVMSESDKRIVAYHESGHAIVSHLLPDADKVRKVTIIPHGLNALGFMQSMPEEEKVLYSYEWLLDRIAVTLGGRVAEKMMTGRIYSGAQNDLQQATRLAKHMVMQFGMSDKIGHVSYDLEGARPAVGRPMSEATNRAIDAEVKRIIEEQLKRVEKLLTENRTAVQTMGDELMEKETLRSEDMERIIAVSKPNPKGSEKK